MSRDRIDESLWAKAKDLSTSTDRQVEAATLILQNYRKLPSEAAELIKKLAANESEDVRIAIAQEVVKGHIPHFLYHELLDILENDHSPRIQQIIKSEREQRAEQFKSIQESIAAFKDIQSFPDIANLGAASALSELPELLSTITSMPMVQFPAKDLIASLENFDILNQTVARDIFTHSSSFFPPAELEIVREAPKLAKQSQGKDLVERLYACPSGRKSWKRYQNICKEILVYCLVPPLNSPKEENTIQNRTQRRDLIFNIPHGSGDFWAYVTFDYESIAIIVDCKNYKSHLKPNDVVIVSKYFGRKRLTRFGLVITRKGLSEGAKKQQAYLWQQEDKLILCLTDNDLAKMVELKESNDNPTKVIDEAHRIFKASL